jgi:hAT family C-terminal dimerisation region
MPEFKTCYLEMQTSASALQPCEKKGKASSLKKLICETQSLDKDEEMCNSTSTADMDPARRWQSDFLNYLNTSDRKLPPGMSTIQWWGVCIYFIGLFLLTNTDCLVLLKINGPRYGPVWSLIAWDYLSIMASSVLNEQAFSQGGITITKHGNHLKGDIVEALQCFKCALHHNLLFHEPGPSSVLEDELDGT